MVGVHPSTLARGIAEPAGRVSRDMSESSATASRLPSVTAAEMREAEGVIAKEPGIGLVHVAEEDGARPAKLAISRVALSPMTVPAGLGGMDAGGLAAALRPANRGALTGRTAAHRQPSVDPGAGRAERPGRHDRRGAPGRSAPTRVLASCYHVTVDADVNPDAACTTRILGRRTGA